MLDLDNPRELEIDGWDPSYKVIFYAEWSDYEENGWVAILEHNGYFYEQNGGYSVFSDDNTDRWQPQIITEDDAIQIMLDWEEHEYPVDMN